MPPPPTNANDEGSSLVLRVHGIAGTLCSIANASPSWSLREVKDAIHAAAGIPPCRQRLLLGRTELLGELEDDASPRLLQTLLEANRASTRADGDQVPDMDRESQLEAFRECGLPHFDLTLVHRSEQQVRWLQMAKSFWWELLEEPTDVWADREVVLAAVQSSEGGGQALQHVHPDLASDREVVLAAVQNRGMALQFASPVLAADRKIALAAVSQCERALLYVAAVLLEDRAFLLEAMRRNGRALEHAPSAVRGDREVVLTAVAQTGMALAGASADLRADHEVVETAVAQNAGAVYFASGGLKSDPRIKELAKKGSRRNSRKE